MKLHCFLISIYKVIMKLINREQSLNQNQGDRYEENQKLKKILEKKNLIEKEIEEFNVMENELSIKIESLKLEVFKEKNRARELELKIQGA